jgi:hypothetical protein
MELVKPKNPLILVLLRLGVAVCRVRLPLDVATRTAD